MKKYAKMLCLALMGLAMMCSCSKRSQVEIGIRQANLECPISISEDMELSSFTVEGDYVVFTYTVLEQILEAESIYDLMNAQSIIQSAAQDEESKALFAAMADADMGLKTRVIGQASNFCKDHTYEAQQIREWLKDIESGKIDTDAAKYLEASFENAKKQCPLQVDELTTMIDCGFDGTDVYYIYQIDEEVLSMTDFAQAEEVMKEQIIAGLRNPENRAVQPIIARMKEIGAQFYYVYVGTLDEETTVQIVIDPNEL